MARVAERIVVNQRGAGDVSEEADGRIGRKDREFPPHAECALVRPDTLQESQWTSSETQDEGSALIDVERVLHLRWIQCSSALWQGRLQDVVALAEKSVRDGTRVAEEKWVRRLRLLHAMALARQGVIDEAEHVTRRCAAEASSCVTPAPSLQRLQALLKEYVEDHLSGGILDMSHVVQMAVSLSREKTLVDRVRRGGEATGVS
jgi:hypothetical protein